MEYTCIYCKNKKDESEFNREHVVPQMMGRYTNGLVLSDNQVCEACNSYFCGEIENKISMDSYEAFLRMKSGTRRMSEGRRIGHTRIRLSGVEGIYKGLSFIAVSDNTSDRLHYEIEPCVGFKKSENEYDYVSIENIEKATEDKLKFLKKFNNPIIQIGYEQDAVEKVLIEKGYIDKNAVCTKDGIREVFENKDFITSIKFNVDSYVRRVCAKTVFNYLCYKYSSEEMLKQKYDDLRNYIRYGKWSERLWFKLVEGFLNNVNPPNNTAHAVGTMIHVKGNVVELIGCVTWFGELTYIFKICDIEPDEQNLLSNGLNVVTLPQIETSFTYFDNVSTNITDDNAVFFYR